MRNTPIRPVAIATVLLAAASLANVANAAALSHVEAGANAGVRGQPPVSNFDGNTVPYWRGGSANAASTSVRAQGMDGYRQVDVTGRASSRADFSAIRASASGDLGPLNDYLMPSGTAEGKGLGTLYLDWTISGAAGLVGSINVSGALFAAGYVGNPVSAVWGFGNAGVWAVLRKDCGVGQFCGVRSVLEARADGPQPVLGYQEKDYTLTLPVQAGDHVTLEYLVYAEAGGGGHAWAGTTPVDLLPGAAVAKQVLDADTDVRASAADSASFAQQIWLTGGLGLDNTEGLTLLADGRYGFGSAVATVPEPCTWMLSAIGLLGLVAWRRRSR